MAWWRCLPLGAAGGAVVEVLSVLGYVLAWQRARRTPSGRVKKYPPRLVDYVDVPAHAWLLAIRMPMGASVAWLFSVTGQISGPAAAVAFGIAAPAVLAQLGRLPEVKQAVEGQPPPSTDPATTTRSPVPERVEQVERP
jgi:hypothetical protein